MTEFNTIHAENMALSATTRDRYQQNLDLIHRVLDIYSLKFVAETLSNNWTRDRLKRWLNGKSPACLLSDAEEIKLQKMLPQPPVSDRSNQFRFIDLFAGIGGIRKGFDAIGGQCVFTSEWNPHAIRTYKANWYNDPEQHTFNTDIRDITLSNQPDKNEQQAYLHIDRHIPDHEVLLAGFPCQPFSLAGVSKKNSLGRKHGFECETQGTLFFDVARIIAAKQPAIFVLENVKNLKSHDNGNTFRVIMNTLDELGYHVADAAASGADDPKVIDGKHFLPQHRERIVLVGFRRDLQLGTDFTLRNIVSEYPVSRPALADLLDKNTDQRYILSPRLWEYLYYYAKKHRQKGNGFGYGLVDPDNPTTVCRTLSARYYKDGSEILLDRGWDSEKGETDFYDIANQAHRPRRLSPRECARLMGFDAPGEANFRIPVSDTQAYRQFGNSVVVPVFAAVARLLKPYIMQSKIMQNKRKKL